MVDLDMAQKIWMNTNKRLTVAELLPHRSQTSRLAFPTLLLALQALTGLVALVTSVLNDITICGRRSAFLLIGSTCRRQVQLISRAKQT